LQKDRILIRALKKTRCTRTLTFILSLAGRGNRNAGRSRLGPDGLHLIVSRLSPLPARERMKVRVHFQRAISFARASRFRSLLVPLSALFSPLPARERMKVRVLIQHAIPFARASRFCPSSFRPRTAQKLVDCAQNLLNILKHLVIPETKDPVASRIKKLGPDLVFSRALGVLRAVEFDDHPSFRRTEIGEVRPDGMLTSEFDVMHSATPQMAPKYPLRVCLFAPQAPRVLLRRPSRAHRFDCLPSGDEKQVGLKERSPFSVPSPCKGEDEGEGPYSARDSLRARFTILSGAQLSRLAIS
jgi:hypothetical protein